MKASSVHSDSLFLIEQSTTADNACDDAPSLTSAHTLTLGQLPTGARLVVRCKADWRTATVSVVTPEFVKILINSPRGGTYRIRRPPDALLHTDGDIPVLTDCDETAWRDLLADYDNRW